jgi:hypothetical protein
MPNQQDTFTTKMALSEQQGFRPIDVIQHILERLHLSAQNGETIDQAAKNMGVSAAELTHAHDILVGTPEMQRMFQGNPFTDYLKRYEQIATGNYPMTLPERAKALDFLLAPAGASVSEGEIADLLEKVRMGKGMMTHMTQSLEADEKEALEAMHATESGLHQTQGHVGTAVQGDEAVGHEQLQIIEGPQKGQEFDVAGGA